MTSVGDPCDTDCGDDGVEPDALVDSGAGCEPGPGNDPIAPIFNASAQQAVDLARRAAIQAGAHGYRVALVWARRDYGQQYQEIKRIDLMPARVDAISRVSWQNGDAGGHADGSVAITWVSLAQVSEHDLMGKLDKKDPPDDVNFFYEITRFKRCADDEPAVMRYTPSSLPEFDLAGHQWVITVQDQHNPRTTDGQDQTFKPAIGLPKSKLRV